MCGSSAYALRTDQANTIHMYTVVYGELPHASLVCDIPQSVYQQNNHDAIYTRYCGDFVSVIYVNKDESSVFYRQFLESLFSKEHW